MTNKQEDNNESCFACLYGKGTVLLWEYKGEHVNE